MSTNVYHLQPQPAAADEREPLADAVREVGTRIRARNEGKRRDYSRLDELRSGDPALRRKRARPALAVPPRPVTFFSIEEAAPEAPARQVRRA